jgi:hypothetical protein
LEGLDKLKDSNDLFDNRNHHLPLPRAPEHVEVEYEIVSFSFRPKFVIVNEVETTKIGKNEISNEKERKTQEKNKKYGTNEVKLKRKGNRRKSGNEANQKER